MKKLHNIHPSEILLAEYLTPKNIGAYKLSIEIGIPLRTAHELFKGNRNITPELAAKLGKYLGNSPEYWLDLQNDFDTEVEKRQNAKNLNK